MAVLICNTLLRGTPQVRWKSPPLFWKKIFRTAPYVWRKKKLSTFLRGGGHGCVASHVASAPGVISFLRDYSKVYDSVIYFDTLFSTFSMQSAVQTSNEDFFQGIVVVQEEDTDNHCTSRGFNFYLRNRRKIQCYNNNDESIIKHDCKFKPFFIIYILLYSEIL